MASRLPAYGWEPIVIAPPAFVSDEDSFGTDAINEETAGVNGERIWRTGPPVLVEDVAACRVAAMAYGGPMQPRGVMGKVIPSRFSAPGLCAVWEKHAGALAEKVMNQFPDIEAVFVQGPSAPALEIALEISVRHGVPVLFDIQSPLTRRSPFAPSGSLRSGDGSGLEEKLLTSGYSIITPTRELKEYFLKKYFGRVSHDDITIIADTPLEDADDQSLSGEGAPDSLGRPVFLLQRLTEKEIRDFLRELAKSAGEQGGCCTGSLVVTGLPAEHLLKKSGLEGTAEIICPSSEEGVLTLCRNASLVLFAAGRQDGNALRVPELLVDVAGMGVPFAVSAPEGVLARFAQDAGGRSLKAGEGDALGVTLKEIIGSAESATKLAAEDIPQHEKVMEALVREIALTLPV